MKPYDNEHNDPLIYEDRYSKEMMELEEVANKLNIMFTPSSETCTTHPLIVNMSLNEESFRKIYDGTKTIEVRLNDAKRQRLKIRDVIQFENKDNVSEHMRTRIIGLYKFSSFGELFSSNLLQKTGFGEYTTQEATEKMYAYYSKNEENKYGVLAIEIMVLSK